MDLLPNELHCAIASNLSLADLANYRLVSKRYAGIGAGFLFEYFFFRPTTASLERMNLILNNTHANLKRHVKNLDFEGKHDEPTGRDNEEPDPRVTVFRQVMEGFTQAGSPITMLGGLGVRLEFFSSENCTTSFVQACANLTTFDVRLDYSDSGRILSGDVFAPIQRTLHAFLASLTNLMYLAIGFRDEDSTTPGSRSSRAPFELNHVIPLHRAWPRLRTLQLEYFYVTERDLVALLSNYETSLRGVFFQGLWVRSVDPSGVEMDRWTKAWRRIFEQFKKMERLEYGTVNGFLRPAPEDVKDWMVQVNGREVAIKTNLYRLLVDDEKESTTDAGNMLGGS